MGGGTCRDAAPSDQQHVHAHMLHVCVHAHTLVHAHCVYVQYGDSLWPPFDAWLENIQNIAHPVILGLLWGGFHKFYYWILQDNTYKFSQI